MSEDIFNTEYISIKGRLNGKQIINECKKWLEENILPNLDESRNKLFDINIENNIKLTEFPKFIADDFGPFGKTFISRVNGIYFTNCSKLKNIDNVNVFENLKSLNIEECPVSNISASIFEIKDLNEIQLSTKNLPKITFDPSINKAINLKSLLFDG